MSSNGLKYTGAAVATRAATVPPPIFSTSCRVGWWLDPAYQQKDTSRWERVFLDDLATQRSRSTVRNVCKSTSCELLTKLRWIDTLQLPCSDRRLHCPYPHLLCSELSLRPCRCGGKPYCSLGAPGPSTAVKNATFDKAIAQASFTTSSETIPDSALKTLLHCFFSLQVLFSHWCRFQRSQTSHLHN